MTNGGYIMFYHNNQIGASCSYATSLDFKTWNYRGKIFTNYSITDSKGNKMNDVTQIVMGWYFPMEIF